MTKCLLELANLPYATQWEIQYSLLDIDLERAFIPIV